VLSDLDPEPAAAILARIALPQRREAQILLQYGENTAGGLMTTQFVQLPQATRSDHALALVRAAAMDKETIYTIYAIDGRERLVGVVSLRELLASDPSKRLSEIMSEQVVSVTPDVDQEEVARLISRYDILSLPVVDEQTKILGVVTVDDVIDVLVEEGTEDAQKMGAVTPIDEPYFVARFRELMVKRVVWLVVLFLGELLTATALKHYEGILTEMIALVVFIPLIISTGGNSGSQSATLIIRALATGEVTVGQFFRVFLREGGMGLALGAVLGSIGFLRAFLWGGNPAGVAVVVGLTITAVVVIGCIIGALLPLVLKRLRLDPALMSAPFIASMIDVTGVVIYFSIARAVLGL
jgi:magnesium transporter